MKTIAIYNMKGGVGKTTAAVNLAYLAAAAGRRTLLWDLDPQAASTYAFRVRPNVPGFSKKSLEDGRALDAAVKETDFPNLHLLPADFAYRKFERYLDSLGKSKRVVADLLAVLGREFDIVFLDCPAGFSLVIEGVLAAADALLVPVVPTVLSLRTVARVIKWADRSDARATLAAFLSMVDRRKTLHRRATELSAAHPEIFMSGQIPYASVVEQIAVRRMPLSVFAPRDPAAAAFVGIWAELQARLRPDRDERLASGRWTPRLDGIASMIDQLESAERQATEAASDDQAMDNRASAWGDRLSPPCDSFAHRFDTENRDIERSGRSLELRESRGSLFIVAMRAVGDEGDAAARALVQIDNSWALRILAGELSPLSALEQRLGRSGSRIVADIRAMVRGSTLQRVDTRVARPLDVDHGETTRHLVETISTPVRPVLVHPARRAEAQPHHPPVAVPRERAASVR